MRSAAVPSSKFFHHLHIHVQTRSADLQICAARSQVSQLHDIMYEQEEEEENDLHPNLSVGTCRQVLPKHPQTIGRLLYVCPLACALRRRRLEESVFVMWQPCWVTAVPSARQCNPTLSSFSILTLAPAAATKLQHMLPRRVVPR